MLRRAVAAVAAVAVSAAPALPALTSTGGGAAADSVPPGGEGTAGPPYTYTTELVGLWELIPLKDQALIVETEHGYRYLAGQQDSHLVVRLTAHGLKFADSGTQEFSDLMNVCHQRRVRVGVVAMCSVPTGITTAQPLLIEVWPRLGNDYVDDSTLPATFAMTVLGDKGNDVVHFGAGWDFFNGHLGRDRVWGGDGNDWIRTGDGPDLAYGGPGQDQLVGMEGDDTFDGDAGDDLLAGGPGQDRLDGGPGSDFVMCNDGADTAWDDGDDVLRYCETIIGP